MALRAGTGLLMVGGGALGLVGCRATASGTIGAVRLMGATVRQRASGIGWIAALLALVGASAAHAQLMRQTVDSVKAATVYVEVTNRGGNDEEGWR